MNIKDRAIVRELASRVAEIAADPSQEEKRKLWTAHNGLRPTRPMVLCFPEGAWSELLPGSMLECEDDRYKGIERRFRTILYAWENLRDDQVIEPYYDVGYVWQNSGWGLAPERVTTDAVERGAASWEPSIVEASDIEKLRFPEITIDHETTQKNVDFAKELLGDILEVRLRGSFWWSLGMIGQFALMRGMQQFMIDLIDRPEWVDEAMSFMRDGTLHMLDQFENEGVLSPNNGANYVGSGGIGITDELTPGASGTVRLEELWGFSESQEVVGVSPAMHEQFVLQYQIPILERFGLNYYGCCEPLHLHIDRLKKIPRLRRISISPWADLKSSAEQLKDDYIFCWKPNPADLAMEKFSEARIRNRIREALDVAGDCRLEIIMKDTHTIRAEPARLHAWTRIAREMVENS